ASKTNAVSHILDLAIRSRARCYSENEVDFLVDERKATRGGLVKIDWTQAPFTALYRNFNANVCVWSNGVSSCKSNSLSSSNNAWFVYGDGLNKTTKTTMCAEELRDLQL
ncbi:hypothetical protein Goari_011453, partial [Gossypium aridum]|nr:hypothetical protein [Gossypium aridum]